MVIIILAVIALIASFGALVVLLSERPNERTSVSSKEQSSLDDARFAGAVDQLRVNMASTCPPPPIPQRKEPRSRRSIDAECSVVSRDRKKRVAILPGSSTAPALKATPTPVIHVLEAIPVPAPKARPIQVKAYVSQQSYHRELAQPRPRLLALPA